MAAQDDRAEPTASGRQGGDADWRAGQRRCVELLDASDVHDVGVVGERAAIVVDGLIWLGLPTLRSQDHPGASQSCSNRSMLDASARAPDRAATPTRSVS